MTSTSRHGARRRARRGERELSGVAASLARSVRTGSTLLRAFDEVARSTPGASGDQLRDVLRAVERGVGVDDALARWAAGAGSTSVDLLVAAARFGHREGGDLAAALDGAAVSLLDACDAADEARAMTSQARSSAAVLVALPVLGAALFCLLDPTVAHTLAMTSAGRLCVLVAVLLDAAGGWVMSRLVRAAVS